MEKVDRVNQDDNSDALDPARTDDSAPVDQGLDPDLRDRLLQAALWYATLGLRVTPVAPRKKNPMIRDWPDRASTNPAEIKKWWETWPEANIGIVAGPRSKIVVLDVDNKNGQDGSGILQLLIDENGPLPPTPTVCTVNGGFHYYFRCPIDGVQNGILQPGLEIKSDDRHLLVAPPSVYQNGRAYEWMSGCRPDEVAFADFPHYLRPSSNGNSVEDPPTEDGRQNSLYRQIMDGSVNMIRNGIQWSTLRRIGGSLRGRGASRDEILTYLLEVYHRCCRPDDNEAKVIEIADFLGSRPPGPRQPVNNEQRIGGPPTIDFGLPINAVVRILAEHDEWQGVFANDTFNHRIITLREPPFPAAARSAEPWKGQWHEKHDASRLQMWFKKKGYSVFYRNIIAAVRIIAERNPVNLPQQELQSTNWDQQERVWGWLSKYLGAEPSEYHNLVGVWWLVGLVKRILHPGCSVDHLLVLEGPDQTVLQDALRIMAGHGRFGLIQLTVNELQRIQSIRGRTIIAIPDFNAQIRTIGRHGHAFLTRQNDHVQLHSGRTRELFGRQGILVATTESYHYLGNSRSIYWPVRTGRIDLTDLAQLNVDRSQLIAEAIHLLIAGSAPAPTAPEEYDLCRVEQDKRARPVTADGRSSNSTALIRAQNIRDYIAARPGPFTAKELWCEALGQSTTTTSNISINTVIGKLIKLHVPELTKGPRSKVTDSGSIYVKS